jgi:hypothetical protein
MGNPWYRVYVGTCADPKIGEAALIADTSRSIVIAAWQCILESASDADARGEFTTTPRRVGAALFEPTERMVAVFAAFAELGMIRDNLVVAWERRQPTRESTEDAAERQRRHRAAKAAKAARAAEAARVPESDLSGEEPRHTMSHDVTRCHPLEGEEEEEREDPSFLPPVGARGTDFEERLDAKPFAELTGAEIVPLRTDDPFEAEARAAAIGLPLSESPDFQAISRLVSEGIAEVGDVLTAIADARERGKSCPKTWAKLENWTRAAAIERLRLASRPKRAERSAEARAPPALGEAALGCFETVWAGFPRDKVASRPKALAAFADLSADEQRQFAANIGTIAEHIRGQKLTSPHNLATFITARKFAGFASAPITAAPQFRVSRDSPAGVAWEAERRRNGGRGVPWLAGGDFWTFPSEFPPSYEQRQNAA